MSSFLLIRLSILALSLLLLCPQGALSVHDALSFHIEIDTRVCFYEDFDKVNPVRTIEAFVLSGGDLDIKLTIHGPLDLDDIRLVS